MANLSQNTNRTDDIFFETIKKESMFVIDL